MSHTARRIAWTVQGSSMATMLSLLALTLRIDRTTASNTLSSLVFGCQWVAPLVWPTGIARLIGQRSALRVASASELSSAAALFVLLASGLLASPLVVLCLALCKGFSDSLTRAAAAAAIKRTGDSASEVARDTSRLEFQRIIGTTTAGVLFGEFGDGLPCEAMLGLCAGLFLLGAASFFVISMRSDANTQATFPATVHPRHDAGRRLQARYWLYTLGVITAFQGLHNALRVPYPTRYLQLDASAIGFVSALATTAVFAGAWLSSRTSASLTLKPSQVPWLLAATTLAVLLCFSTRMPAISYGFYFLFMAVFEYVFMKVNVQWVASIDKLDSARLFNHRSVLLAACALVGLLATDSLLQFFSTRAAAITTALLLLAAGLVVWAFERRNRVQHDDVLL